MAANQVIKSGSIDNVGVTKVGANYVYSSDAIQLQNVNSLEVVIKYSNNLPDPEVDLARYNLVAVLEEKISDTQWRPFLTQGVPFVKKEQGPENVLIYGKGIFNLDDNVPFDMSNGTDIIAREYRKQGNLATEFRVCIVVNSYVEPSGDPEAPTAGEFISANVDISYKTYNV